MKPGSLHARLRWLIIVVLLVVLLPLAMFSFRRTITEVDELSDGRLAQSARTLQVLIAHAGMDALRSHDASDMQVPARNQAVFNNHEKWRKDTESEVGFQIFDRHGQLILATSNLIGLPAPQPGDAGFHDVRHDGYRWRVFTLNDATDGMLIRSGERYDSRHDIEHAVALGDGLLLLIGLPLLAVLLGWAIRRGLRPLDRLARALSTRQPGNHEPVMLDDAPRELQPVLEALNTQLARMEDALERERRFSADVAHELRTPLASAMINLENAMVMDEPVASRGALTNTQSGLTALARRIDQLLAFARLEAGAAAGERTPVDLVAVAMDVVEELAPVIADSGVELSLLRQASQVVVPGYEAALNALLRNLVENALRHVPAGGHVQLTIDGTADTAIVDVIDDGPGIPAERRAAVFARFHRERGSRGDGFGLGLSIVQRAAQLHAATIELLDAPHGSGLRVHIVIPRPG